MTIWSRAPIRATAAEAPDPRSRLLTPIIATLIISAVIAPQQYPLDYNLSRASLPFAILCFFASIDRLDEKAVLISGAFFDALYNQPLGVSSLIWTIAIYFGAQARGFLIGSDALARVIGWFVALGCFYIMFFFVSTIYGNAPSVGAFFKGYAISIFLAPMICLYPWRLLQKIMRIWDKNF